jgi:hypothetical protein
MGKIQKISELQPTLPFSEYDIYKSYRASFESSELGEIYKVFPFKSLSEELKLKQRSRGRNAYFSPEGKIALMVLKSYSELSDRALIAQLNANIHYQLFCGVRIDPARPLTNFKIVSEIRCELASKLNIDRSQTILADYWKPYLKDVHVLLTDATCYETDMRYPTDVKLLWESVEWLYKHLKKIISKLRKRMPRTKYLKQELRYKRYSKKRKRTQTETRVLKRSLLHLLGKLIFHTGEIIEANMADLEVTEIFNKRFEVIKKVLVQQQDKFSGKEVKNLIVSIDKDYIRPIVRGKENKRVEFGAKVNTIQIDGINFIEHLNFEAFHEGIRLESCIRKQQELMHVKVTHLSADAIYATNANRTHCSQKNIYTGFKRKGRASKEEAQYSQLRSELNKERSTRLEGSFGTEKRYYSLHRIKARRQKTEILWIFFGIHTANAVRMTKKVQKQQELKLAG